MDLISYLINKYKLPEAKAQALVKSGLIKVKGKYVNENVNLLLEDDVSFNKRLLDYGFEFFDLLEISKKHVYLFENVKNVFLVRTNESEKEFFRLAGFNTSSKSGELLYASNVYPLDMRNLLNKNTKVVIVKYTNNYDEFRFKKEILDELLKSYGFTLVDVYLSLYSYNQYVIYRRNEVLE